MSLLSQAVWSKFFCCPFLLKFPLIFGGLYSVNISFIGLASPGGMYIQTLDRHLNYLSWMTKALLQLASLILQISGYRAHTTGNRLWTDHSAGIVLSYGCLGCGLFSFFSAFVISWPQQLKAKVLFLAGGFVVLQLLNGVRLALLAMYGNGSLGGTNVNHHLIFNVLIYLVIGLSICCWVNKRTEPLP